jgi:2-polyprenyl-6-methoxyphenol hydroxylase-like FAD-dependent oxidoreductase
LHAVLAEALEGPIGWNTAAETVKLAGRRVRVHLAGGGRSRTEEFGFVVGADGVRSVVRSAVARSEPRHRSSMTSAAWRFLAPNPGVTCWTAWSGEQGTVLLIPVDPGRVYGYVSCTGSVRAIRNNASQGGPPLTETAWLTTTFAGFPQLVRDVVAAAATAPDRMYFSPGQKIQAPRWSCGRIVLIGDAAHALGPIWAQGAALALEDGIVLSRLLAEHADYDQVGPEFERLRRHRVRSVARATARMSRVAALPGWLRDTAGPILGPLTYRAAYGPLRAPLH